MKLSANIEVLYYELPWKDRFAAAKADGFNYLDLNYIQKIIQKVQYPLLKQ
ncbi:MAG: hypothetical protein J6584_05230 [Lactobacillus sp.]|uniref:hypothetical protein n=1 Tax=Bombilactobacillus bombi TaxID=1303590 RepID=UPI0015FA7CD0|nr:hypothetical protein [Bombilactobacillus bombi]MCO6543347.1 hypothetical protein [Lactobacillus sp.]